MTPDASRPSTSVPLWFGRFRKGTLAAWVVVLFWGLHYVVLYRPLRLIDPERYLILRFFWAAVLVLIFLLFVPVLRGISLKNWQRLLLLSLVGIVAYQWVFLKAASLLDPVSLVLILSLGPVLVALYGHLKGHDSFSPLQWGAMALIGVGIFLVVRGALPQAVSRTGSERHGEGLLMALLSLLFFTVWTLMTREMTRRVSTLQITLVPVLLGGACPDPAAPGLDPPSLRRSCPSHHLLPALFDLFCALLFLLSLECGGGRYRARPGRIVDKWPACGGGDRFRDFPRPQDGHPSDGGRSRGTGRILAFLWAGETRRRIAEGPVSYRQRSAEVV